MILGAGVGVGRTVTAAHTAATLMMTLVILKLVTVFPELTAGPRCMITTTSVAICAVVVVYSAAATSTATIIIGCIGCTLLHVVIVIAIVVVTILVVRILSLLVVQLLLLLHELVVRILVQIVLERHSIVEVLVGFGDRMAIVFDLLDLLEVLAEGLARMLRADPPLCLLRDRRDCLVLDHCSYVDGVVHSSEDAALIRVLYSNILEQL